MSKRVSRPPGQRDVLMLAVPAGGLHLPELQQQLPVAAGGCAVRHHEGVLRSFSVQDVEPRRAAALCTAEAGAPETGAADQQQPAPPDPPQLGTTKIGGLCWSGHSAHTHTCTSMFVLYTFILLFRPNSFSYFFDLNFFKSHYFNNARATLPR